jgi:hypothetical protein
MILDLIKSYATISKYQFEKYDDDGFVEKLSRKFSAIMMIVFATCLSVFQLVGKPIKCWSVYFITVFNYLVLRFFINK